jgi:hypothetical protein
VRGRGWEIDEIVGFRVQTKAVRTNNSVAEACGRLEIELKHNCKQRDVKWTPTNSRTIGQERTLQTRTAVILAGNVERRTLEKQAFENFECFSSGNVVS